MISESELLFQLGAVMLLAFVAATVARKVNQSVMIGYILIGVFIGPQISLDVLGYEYNGLIHDMSFIQVLSHIGLIMLMFFVGLEFSFTKLKKTKTPAIILAVIDTSIGLFVGFVFASVLGWPLVDSIFLAGIIAMSSTSIAMKILFDLRRMSSPEVEFLIGLVVVETFIAMLILAVASGMIIQPEAQAVEYGRLLLGMAAFYAFFVWIAIWAVPKVVSFFSNIESDEMFILFVLGMVFLTAGVASLMNVPPIIGAFFMGMVLAESKVTLRVQNKIESFKDAFVAIFFTAFGMMIDPAMFGDVIWLVLAAIAVVVVYEVLAISGICYLLGFSSRASTTIGTSMSGRGIESILYASVGSEVKGATMGAQLMPFAGAFCFGMSVVSPQLVKHSARLARFFSRIIPRSFKFSASIVSRTIGKAVMPSPIRLFKGARATGALLLLFVLVAVAVLISDGTMHFVLMAVGLVMSVGVFVVVRSDVTEIARHVNYSNLGVVTNDKHVVVDLVSGLVFGAVVSVLIIVATWTFMWQLSLLVAVAYIVLVVALMRWAHKALYVEGAEIPQKVYQLRTPFKAEGPEPMADLPKPVYGVARPMPGRNARL